jgi:hypothetical protein
MLLSTAAATIVVAVAAFYESLGRPHFCGLACGNLRCRSRSFCELLTFEMFLFIDRFGFTATLMGFMHK